MGKLDSSKNIEKQDTLRRLHERRVLSVRQSARSALFDAGSHHGPAAHPNRFKAERRLRTSLADFAARRIYLLHVCPEHQLLLVLRVQRQGYGSYTGRKGCLLAAG